MNGVDFLDWFRAFPEKDFGANVGELWKGMDGDFRGPLDIRYWLCLVRPSEVGSSVPKNNSFGKAE